MSQGGLCGRWTKHYRNNTWLKISLLLCVFGFLKEFRPSEPFIYEFLIGGWRNITEDQVTQEVYPIGGYSYLASLMVIFLITDLSRYKPLIVLLGLCGMAIWAMLAWTTSLVALQILEVIYGIFMATEVAYYTYIYAKVDKDYYQQVSSHTRAAVLIGRGLAGITGQILISTEAMDYLALNYITFGALSTATIWALFLPPVKRSIYFHQTENEGLLATSKYTKAFHLMKRHFIESYRQKYVIKWSVWWALTTAGFIQIQSYVQPLWEDIRKTEDDADIYNGAIEASATVLGFLMALVAGFLKVNWKARGELILSVCAVFQGCIMLVSSQTDYVYVAYVCYAIFCSLYQFMITIASSEIAKNILDDSFGLIFGLNSFIAVIVQTMLTMFLVTNNIGFALNARDQYLAYSIYHFVIASLFIVIGVRSWYVHTRQ